MGQGADAQFSFLLHRTLNARKRPLENQET